MASSSSSRMRCCLKAARFSASRARRSAAVRARFGDCGDDGFVSFDESLFAWRLLSIFTFSASSASLWACSDPNENETRDQSCLYHVTFKDTRVKTKYTIFQRGKIQAREVAKGDNTHMYETLTKKKMIFTCNRSVLSLKLRQEHEKLE